MKNSLIKSMWIIFPIVLFSIFPLASAQQAQEELKDAQDPYYLGNVFLGLGDYDQAISHFNRALEINPRYAHAYYSRGDAYYRKGQYDQAISDYTKGIEINPKYAKPYYNRGSAYYHKGQLDQAISDFNKALEINPGFTQAYNNRGLAYGRKGEYDQAILDYNKALEINPGFAQAYNNRGLAYGRKGEYDQAILDYNKALEIDPRNAVAYYNRGSAYYHKGQFDQVISDYNKALEINPRYAAAYINRGLAYGHKGEFDRAMSDYTKGIEINPKYAEAYYNRGMVYVRKNQYDEAISEYTKALEINPRDAKAYFYRGIAYDKQGQYVQAISDFTKALEINPRDANAYNGLAWLLATAKEPSIRNGEKAVEHALKACELSDWKDPNSLDTLAAAYARVGDFSNAIKWQEKALESPNLTDKNRIEYQRRLKSYQQSKPWPEESSNVNPEISPKKVTSISSQEIASQPILYFGIEKEDLVIRAVYPEGKSIGTLARGQLAGWSPRRDRFAYFTNDKATGAPIVNIMGLGGQQETVFESTPNEKIFASGWQSIWSPDGTKIALIVAKAPKGIFAITIVEVESKKVIRQFELPSSAYADMNWPPYNLKWSPDGRKILLAWQQTLVLDLNSKGFDTITITPAMSEWSAESEGVWYFDHLFHVGNLFLKRTGQDKAEKVLDRSQLASWGMVEPVMLHGPLIKLSPNRKRLAMTAGVGDKLEATVLVFDIGATRSGALGSPAKRLHLNGAIFAMEWGSDEKKLAVLRGSEMGLNLDVLDLESGKSITLVKEVANLDAPGIDMMGFVNTVSWVP